MFVMCAVMWSACICVCNDASSDRVVPDVCMIHADVVNTTSIYLYVLNHAVMGWFLMCL